MRRFRSAVVLLTAIALVTVACTRNHPLLNRSPGGGFSGGGIGGGQGAGSGIEPSGEAPVGLGIKPDHADVNYCSLPGVPSDQEDMDIYDAKGSSGGPTPAVIYVHGGGWVVGDKAKERPYPGMTKPVVTDWITGLQDKGILVAAVNYPLAIHFPMPLGIEGVKCAVRFLRAKAGTYNIDPNRIGAFGGSAGGHLVALLDVTNGSGMWEAGSYLNESSKVEAVVDLFGPTDISLLAQERSSPIVARVLDHVFDGSDNFAKYSPVTYADSANVPPILIMNGEQDPGVPPQQAQALYDKLHSAGAPAQLVLVKNAGHGFVPMPSSATINPSLGQIDDDIVGWFTHHLG